MVPEARLTRSTRAEVADRSAAVLAALREAPAVDRAALADCLGLPLPALRRILSDLVSSGDLVHTSSRVAVPPESVPVEHAPTPGLSPVQRRASIVAWLAESPVSPSMREMARRYGVKPPTIDLDVRQMVKAGAVAVDPTLVRHHRLRLTGRPWVEPREKFSESNTPRAERLARRDAATA